MARPRKVEAADPFESPAQDVIDNLSGRAPEEPTPQGVSQVSDEVALAAVGPAAPLHDADMNLRVVVMNLPVDGITGDAILDGRKVRHMASCRLHEEGTEWARPEHRQWPTPKLLPGHPGTVFYKTRFKDFDKGWKEAYVVYTPSEKVLYRVMDA